MAQADQLLRQFLPVCVVAYAQWSDVSMSIAQFAQELEDNFRDKVRFEFFNYDAMPEKAREIHNIKAVPLIRLLRDDEIVFSQYGGIFKKTELKHLIERYLTS